MIKQIEEWESKGFRISIYPLKEKHNWYWVAGVYLNDSSKAIWLDSNNNLPNACYNSYQEAFDKIKDFIVNYKPKKLKK